MPGTKVREMLGGGIEISLDAMGTGQSYSSERSQ
jgi:hypothetical protein